MKGLRGRMQHKCELLFRFVDESDRGVLYAEEVEKFLRWCKIDRAREVQARRAPARVRRWRQPTMA